MLLRTFSCIMVTLVVAGCSGVDLFGNDSGIVYVMYDTIIPQAPVPVDVVNTFLLREGYNSRVVGTYYQLNGYSIQKIYLGADVDPSPLLNGLRNLPGVLLADLDMETDHLFSTAPEGALDELEID